MGKSVFWFRRDLRFDDNTGLMAALEKGPEVLPIFIFDDLILNELRTDDPRVTFIYRCLKRLNEQLEKHGSGLKIFKGEPIRVLKELIGREDISDVFTNKDYEPYARKRDLDIRNMLKECTVGFHCFKDQVIFEEGEIVKDNGEPYHVFTPYKNKWLRNFDAHFRGKPVDFDRFLKQQFQFPSLEELGFEYSHIEVKEFDVSHLSSYKAERDFPSIDGTTRLGPHLRFGTVSIRRLTAGLGKAEETFLSELIWREFFMQILYHYPDVVNHNFKKKYNGIVWRNNNLDFEKWCLGLTGYPMVDAGMRQLNETGYMHNRVRMITAGFLCKHLLIDWRWGEAYFASKLLDYELSSNNGNWQWAAGTGCDAAPYFRIFNPHSQQIKFDKDKVYIRRWIPEIDDPGYPEPMIEHKYARERALEAYKKGID
jgi:deoxyribodipyrimidine photo-lyase